MATVNTVILKQDKKADGTYNVKFRVYHNNDKRYIPTEHFVSDRQIDENGKLKDRFIKDLCRKRLKKYRKLISKLGYRLEFFSAEGLRDYLVESLAGKVDFVRFSREYISQLRKESETKGKEGKGKTAEMFNTVVNSMVDFFRRDKILINEITVEFLWAFERFLKTKRRMDRFDQFKRPTTIERNGLSDTSVNSYLRSLRSLFKHAMKRYNNTSLGIKRIKHYPFTDYSIPDAPETRKRNVDVQTAYRIMNAEAKPGSVMEIARDMFKISFYMCGMNAIDLYYWDESNIINGRFGYNRKKTMNRRKDNAFISVKVVDEVGELIPKYLELLKKRYKTSNNLNQALSRGMRKICQALGIDKDITLYWARHTFGNLARNKAGCSKDDVALALNHVEHGLKTTDIYIEKDWLLLDKVQKKTIKFMRKKIKQMKMHDELLEISAA